MDAVANFLADPHTKTPLTLSIEGSWGSGKSSFMLQLEDALRAKGRKKLVRFNAWQYNADDGLWAVFIRDFDRQMNKSLTIRERIAARFRLIRLRISWQDTIETLKMVFGVVLTTIALVAIGQYLYLHFSTFAGDFWSEKDPTKAAGKTLAVIGGMGGSAAALLLFFHQLGDLLGSPANLKKGTKLFSRPSYTEKLPLIDQITHDFQSLVTAYAGNDDVYVFIDDLDRCEYSKAAELLQSMLTLLSSAPRIGLILGLDRDKVAAALAAKQEKLLPYLYNVDARDTFAVGMQYGHRFLEKFIQLSYALPVPRVSGLKAMINPDVKPPEELFPPSQKSAKAIQIVNGEDDSGTLNQCIDMADAVFDHNPRNVKQFINAFRLQTFIANETGLLGSTGATRVGAALTLPQFAKFVALCTRWSRLVEAVIAKPNLMKALEDAAWKRSSTYAVPGETPMETGMPDEVKSWLKDGHLVALLCFGGQAGEFSIAQLDFRRLSEIVPVPAGQFVPGLREDAPLPPQRVVHVESKSSPIKRTASSK
ncbi:KAP family P-loop NTPase fold protein [Granulicella aggregans]|uniref:KAP family P-loop NTPase fold protein n=1 Tax=Granulicella aggregans TaxID=474949 RepID=UPI0021DFEF8C|nr:KAP family NTPase [Granulicella aggregans]